MRSRDSVALLALGAILAVTVAWWALALWPLPDAAPEWLVRTRAICFGSAPDGLPDAGGWVMLIGEPIGMLAVLFIVWGRAVRSGLRALAASVGGRIALVVVASFLFLAAGAAAARVTGIGEPPGSAFFQDDVIPETYPRLDRPPPPLDLVDQHGERFALDRFRGRPVLVTFAYAHCTTVCPLVVQDALRAQDRLSARRPAVVVVTLDPWRDTPARLPHIARAWALGSDARVLGGEVEAVNAALDAWDVPRGRDPRTGEITHPALVYILDADGTIAYAVRGTADAIVELARRL